jgi:hypothetical protein
MVSPSAVKLTLDLNDTSVTHLSKQAERIGLEPGVAHFLEERQALLSQGHKEGSTQKGRNQGRKLPSLVPLEVRGIQFLLFYTLPILKSVQDRAQEREIGEGGGGEIEPDHTGGFLRKCKGGVMKPIKERRRSEKKLNRGGK